MGGSKWLHLFSALRASDNAGEARMLLSYSVQLQVTGLKREIMAIWGDSEVKEPPCGLRLKSIAAFLER